MSDVMSSVLSVTDKINPISNSNNVRKMLIRL